MASLSILVGDSAGACRRRLAAAFAVLAVFAAGCAPALPDSAAARSGGASAEADATPVSTVVVTPTVPETTTTTMRIGDSLRVVHVRDDRSSLLPPFEAVVEHPALEGESPDIDVAEVNDLIAQRVTELADPVVELFAAIGPPQEGEVPSRYHLDYQIAFASEELLCIRLFEETQVSGAEEPTRAVSTMMIDLHSAVTLELADIVASGDAILTVAELAAGIVEATYYRDDPEAFEPYRERILDDAGLRHVLLTESGLEIWFDEFTAGPAELGTPNVTIPFTELEGLLDPDGPAGRFM